MRIILLLLVLVAFARAQTSPCLGDAIAFGILANTYVNAAPGTPGTVIVGDLGYTTPPAVDPTIIGTVHVNDSIYALAGVSQATALAELDAQACTFNFSAGAIDLQSNPNGSIYTPGVYCVSGDMSIGGGGNIYLNGSGTYIFRSTGAFTTSASSRVIINGTASPCDVFWTSGNITTLGANSIMLGTIINAEGITMGSTVNWIGRALAFDSTVTTNVDTISVPMCPQCVVPPVATPTAPAAPAPLSPGAIAGIVIGAAAFVALVVLAVYCVSKPEKPDYVRGDWNG